MNVIMADSRLRLLLILAAALVLVCAAVGAAVGAQAAQGAAGDAGMSRNLAPPIPVCPDCFFLKSARLIIK